MNKTILRGKWRQMQGNLKSEWGRLTDNDRRTLDGKIDQMIGLFQERYGYTQERAVQAFTHYLGSRAGKKVPMTSAMARSWIPIATVTALVGIVTLGWFVMNQLAEATADLDDDDQVEAALEGAIAAPEAL